MDAKDLQELKQLKEQKDAELLRLQDLEALGLSLAAQEEAAEEPADAEKIGAEEEGKTIKFAPVTEETQSEEEQRLHNARQQRRAEAEQRRTKKQKALKTTLISVFSVAAAAAVLLVIYFAVRSANMKKFTYPYWGSGIKISEASGVKHYSFLGKITDLTAYDAIGQVTASAEFDADGNCVKETSFDAAGNVDVYYTHDYENGVRVRTACFKQGQLSTITVYRMLDSRTVSAERTYLLEESRRELSVLALDAEGNAVSETIRGENDLPLLQKKYDGILVTEEIRFDDDGKLATRTVYDYDARGNLLTSTVYDADSAITERTVYQYNEENLLNKTVHYNGEGTVLDYYTYNYDTEKNPIKQVAYDAEGKMIEQVLRTFNNQNRVAKETAMRADGSVVYSRGYEYTEQGYVSRMIQYDPEFSTQIATYTVYTRSETGTVTQADEYNSANVPVCKQIFNADGFPVEVNNFNEAGVMVFQQKTQYDENHNAKQIDTFEFTENGTPSRSVSQQFRKDGLVSVETTEDFIQKTYDQKLMNYAEDGVLLSVEHYGRNGKITEEHTFRDNLLYMITVYENGAEKTSTEYHYDSENRVSYTIEVDLATGEGIKTSYHYSKGVLVSATVTDAGGKSLSREEYDEDGNVTRKTVYDEEGNPLRSEGYDFDEQGRVIVLTEYNENDEIVTRTVYYYPVTGDTPTNYMVYDGEDNLIFDSLHPDGPEDPEDPTDPTDPSDPTEPGSDSTETTDTGKDPDPTDTEPPRPSYTPLPEAAV